MDSRLFDQVRRRLREAGIQPTLQRLAIGAVLFAGPVHLSAEQVLERCRALEPSVSRATVYGTLRLFAVRGLLRELPVDQGALVYDSNLAPHHHVYHADTGEVSDLAEGDLQVLGVPALPVGLELLGVDVIVRVRGRADATAVPGTPASVAEPRSTPA